MARKNGPERVRGRTGRRVDTRTARQRFLIVCEGEQTEPNYFRAFQVPGLVVKTQDVSQLPTAKAGGFPRLKAGIL